MRKRWLVVLDFDGFLLNSYEVIRQTMLSFGLDPGDEARFRDRRKFLKYLGGGKELLGNLVRFPMPATKRLRRRLTECYTETATIYPEFTALLNAMIAHPDIHCGIVSRNFAVHPGHTIRTVLARSGVAEADLDFVIPLPIGIRKREVLAGMHSDRYFRAVLGGDEIGDYRCGERSGYECVIGSYGFDTRARLIKRGGIPEECVFEDPTAACRALAGHLAPAQRKLTLSLSGAATAPLLRPAMGARNPANAALLLSQE